MNESRAWRRWLVQLLAGTVAALSLVLLAPVASATTPDPGLLNPWRDRSGFGGSYYGLGTIEDVQAGKLGNGKRVYLDQALVYIVTPSTVRVDQELYRECPPGQICGAGSFYPVSLTVDWSGIHRPAQAWLIRLYGTTTGTSLTPVGYVKIRYCGARFELCSP